MDRDRVEDQWSMPLSLDMLLDSKIYRRLFTACLHSLSKHSEAYSRFKIQHKSGICWRTRHLEWPWWLKSFTDIQQSQLSHWSHTQAVNYGCVRGWITEESAEMPFKDSLPGLQSPCGLSDLPIHCLFLHLTLGAVIYSLSCCRSSFSPSLPDSLSRTVSEFTESQLSYSDWRSQWL